MKRSFTLSGYFALLALGVGCSDPDPSTPTDDVPALKDREDITQSDTPADTITIDDQGAPDTTPAEDVVEDTAPPTDTPAMDAGADVPVAQDVPRNVPRDVPRDTPVVMDVRTDVSVVTDVPRDTPVDVPIVTPGDPGAVDVRFTVRGDMPTRPISRYIYGWNSPDWTRARGVTFTRVGGNRLTAYNWENNASNAGSDYMFQNDNYLCQNAGCNRPGETIRRAIDDSFAHDASILVTVPMAGYVSADTLGGGDVRRTTNYLTTRFRRSVARKGAAFTLTPDLTDANVYQDEFANWVDRTWPTSSRGTREVFYALDNEPDLWSSTHAEIHPTPARYDEMVTRTTELAAALKDVNPNALVFGPVSYGWQGYVNLQNAPDAMGRDFLDFYLDAMRTAATRAGRRLVDVLDLHWYPEAQGGGTRITADGASAALADARVQAPRSLWDPTYSEDSWIRMWSTMGPIRLIPRMREKIEARYPGTRLAFTEYYYGGGADISGGVAEADVLGVFGRDGVFAANLWHTGDTDDRFIYAALAMYRNYDGNGAAFGDTSVSASTSDNARSAVYASTQTSSPARAVIIAINRANTTVTAGIQVTWAGRFTRAEVYQLTSAAAQPRRAADLTAAATNAFRYAMPPRSVSTIVLAP